MTSNQSPPAPHNDFPVPSSRIELEEMLSKVPKSELICDRPEFGSRVVVRMAPGVVVKYSSDLGEEVLCMRLAKTLPIPVPRVLWHPGTAETRIPWSWTRKEPHPDNVWCIYMDEVEGVQLSQIIDTLPEEAIRTLGTQLRSIVDHIASLPAPTGTIGSVSGDAFRTFMVHPWLQPTRTFTDNNDFLANLKILYARCLTVTPAEAEKRLACLEGPAAVRFTHGDLVPKNIMVSADGTRITGIVDWGNSGFYPDYWEYCRMHDPFQTSSGWEKMLGVIWPEPERTEMIWAVHTMLDTVDLFCR